jgi:hypothetical protein
LWYNRAVEANKRRPGERKHKRHTASLEPFIGGADVNYCPGISRGDQSLGARYDARDRSDARRYGDRDRDADSCRTDGYVDSHVHLDPNCDANRDRDADYGSHAHTNRDRDAYSPPAWRIARSAYHTD